MLRRLFTPEEAELAVHLTLDREEAKVIADRAGLGLAEAEQRLSEMARKGLIFSIEPKGGPGVRLILRPKFGKMAVNEECPELLPSIAQDERSKCKNSLTAINGPSHA